MDLARATAGVEESEMGKGGFVLLLLALGAGVAIGFVGANAGGGAGSFSSSGEYGNGDSGKGSAPAPEPDLVRMPPPPADGYATLGDALDAIPVPRLPRGDGTIRGRVLDEAGQPMAAILVRATPRPDRSYGRGNRTGVPEDRPIEELVKEQVVRILGDRKSRQDAFTGADGRYEIRGIGAGKYFVMAYGDGFQFQPISNRGYEIEAGGEVDFTAKPVFEIEFEIFLADGTPAKGARIERQMYSNWHHAWNWTPANSRMSLEPGVHLIRASDADGAGSVSEEVRCEIGAGKKTDKLTLRLIDRPGIRGTVAFPEDEREGNARIYALAFDGEPPSDQDLARSNLQSYAYSQQGAKFAFPNLAPGRYAVGVASNRGILHRETVDVGAVPVEVELKIPVPDPSEYVVVRVEGPDGPIPGQVQIHAYVRTERNMNSGSGQATRLKDGSYRVLHPTLPESERNSAPVYSVSVSTQTYGQKTVEYDPASEPAVTVRFEAPGTLDIEVAGYEGSAYVGKLMLSVQPKKGDGRDDRMEMRYWSMRSGASGLGRDGKQTFGPLAPGEYEIVMGIQAERGNSVAAGRTPVTIRAGENRQTVQIPKLYSLTVIVPDGDESARISLSPAQSTPYGRSGRSQNAEGGEVRFEDLPAGEYVINGRTTAGRGTMNVVVPGQAVVRFVPELKNAMLVKLSDANGAAGKAGFRDGDLIVGVDGVEFQNEEHMQSLIRAAWAAEGAKFDVLRGRQRISIAANRDLIRGVGMDAVSR